MSFQLSDAGAPSSNLARKAQEWWQDAATRNNSNLAGFDPQAPLSERIAWALQMGLCIATIYSRFSSKQQHSTDDQVRECLVWAAKHGMYVPPEFISIDEGITGKQVRRDGLDRMKGILKARQATVLLVFKVSRLFRQAFKGFQLIQEEVVEENLRAVSVSQGIDTDDESSWKLQLQIHGLMDDLLLDAIADHVRAGLAGLFLVGWTTGAVGVGYRRKELENAPVTKRGLPRTEPEVDAVAAELIRRHAALHLGGMPLKEGWRRWLAAAGPCDPRCTTGRMSYNAYRRLWSNIRLTGRWEFGRKRNRFSTKLDYVEQIEQPESEVATFQCEALRILDDETFLALQKWLRGFKSGPRGPRKEKPAQLWDLTMELFYCAQCSTPEAPVRYYQTGANGKGMQCKHGDLCSAKSAVRREDAVKAICDTLGELIVRDSQLVEQVICRTCELDAAGDQDLCRPIEALQASIGKLSRRINDLFELAGDGSEHDRKEVQARIRAAQVERGAAQLELTRLQNALASSSAALTPQAVQEILKEMSRLLKDAAAGMLGQDAVYQALAVFRQLTGGQIMVHVEQRTGRQRTNVRGVFRPRLVGAVAERLQTWADESATNDEVSVWLRIPPRIDRLAERVHQLIDLEQLSHRQTTARLRAEGHNVNDGNVWYCYRRWYEMQGMTPPKVQYNNGHRRRTS